MYTNILGSNGYIDTLWQSYPVGKIGYVPSVTPPVILEVNTPTQATTSQFIPGNYSFPVSTTSNLFELNFNAAACKESYDSGWTVIAVRIYPHTTIISGITFPPTPEELPTSTHDHHYYTPYSSLPSATFSTYSISLNNLVSPINSEFNLPALPLKQVTESSYYEDGITLSTYHVYEDVDPIAYYQDIIPGGYFTATLEFTPALFFSKTDDGVQLLVHPINSYPYDIYLERISSDDPRIHEIAFSALPEMLICPANCTDLGLRTFADIKFTLNNGAVFNCVNSSLPVTAGVQTQNLMFSLHVRDSEGNRFTSSISGRPFTEGILGLSMAINYWPFPYLVEDHVYR
jgi:hypothetical protein